MLEVVRLPRTSSVLRRLISVLPVKFWLVSSTTVPLPLPITELFCKDIGAPICRLLTTVPVLVSTLLVPLDPKKSVEPPAPRR